MDNRDVLASGGGTLAGQVRTAVEAGPAEAKATLGELLEGVAGNLEKVQLTMAGAGVPRIPNGREVAAAVVGGMTKAKAAAQTARAKVATLPNVTGNELQVAADAVFSDFSVAFGEAFSGSAVVQESEKLAAAFKSEPACARMR